MLIHKPLTFRSTMEREGKREVMDMSDHSGALWRSPPSSRDLMDSRGEQVVTCS